MDTESVDVLRDEYGFVVRIDELTVEELRSAQATHDRQRKVWNALLGGKPRLDVTDPEVSSDSGSSASDPCAQGYWRRRSSKLRKDGGRIMWHRQTTFRPRHWAVKL